MPSPQPQSEQMQPPATAELPDKGLAEVIKKNEATEPFPLEPPRASQWTEACKRLSINRRITY